MAAGGSLKFVVEVAANNANATLAAIQTAVDQAGVKMKTTMLGVGDAARGASEHANSLEGRLRALKGEMVQGDRTINFFARSLNNIVPASSAAGEGIRLLADGIVGGLGLSLAIQGIMAILTSFGEALKETSEEEKKAAEESKKAAEARYKAYEDADRKWRRLAFIRAGGTGEAFDAGEETGAATKSLDEALKKQADAQRRIDIIQNSTLGGRQNEADAERRRAALEAAQRDLALAQATASRIVATGVVAMEKAAGELQDKRSREAEERDRAWVQNPENAVQPNNEFSLPNGPVGSMREQLSASGAAAWTPFVTQGGLDLERATAGVNAETLKRWKSDEKLLAEANKAGEEIGKAFAQPVANALEDAFAQMISGQKSFNESMKDLWKSLSASLAKMAFSMALGAIPGVGGLIGGVGSMMFGPKVPSAAGGWSVPKGWNGLAMVHEEEVILDRQTKKALMGGGGAPINVSISAVDAPSLVALMHSNPEAVLGPIREARRDRRF